MNKSASDYSSYEFDYHANFTQFLEEARKNANEATPRTAHQLEETRKKELDWEKKSRKSWKKSLFSWLKTDKRSKSIKQGGKHFSGPVEATGGGNNRGGRAVSGPLIGLFSSTRRTGENEEVPYMCLGHINNPQKIQSYGPVYLVT